MLSACRRDADDQTGANPRSEEAMRRARHGDSRLAGRDDAKRSVRQSIGRSGSSLFDQACRINRGDAGANDGDEIVAKRVEGTSQCECLGSDQAERPVTTSNCFRRLLTS